MYDNENFSYLLHVGMVMKIYDVEEIERNLEDIENALDVIRGCL